MENMDRSSCPEWVQKGFADLEALAEIFGLKVVDQYCPWQIESPIFKAIDSIEGVAIKVSFGNQTAMIEKHARNFWTDQFIPGVQFLLHVQSDGKDQFLILI